jgi:hypothetical protein
MPGEAIALDAATHVLSPACMVTKLNMLVGRSPVSLPRCA